MNTQWALESLLHVRDAFINNLGDINGVPKSAYDDLSQISANNRKKRKGGAPARVPTTQVLFSLCTAIVHKPDLVGEPLREANLWRHVFDTLVPSERQHCQACLNALVAMQLAAHESKKELCSSGAYVTRDYYTIHPLFRARIFAFTDAVCQQIGANTPKIYDEQLAASRALFDFFHFKYLPRWRYFLASVERTCVILSEDHRDNVDRLLHGHPDTWILVHRYMRWLGDDYTSGRPFHGTLLKEIASSFNPWQYDYGRAQDCLKCLSQDGIALFSITDDQLQPDPRMASIIATYVKDMADKYDSFVREVKALRGSAPA